MQLKRALWAVLGLVGCGEVRLESGELELTAVGNAGAQAVVETAYAKVTPKEVFHVATTGVDTNPGTLIKPWRTITKAARTLLPGQAAYVHAGLYTEHIAVSARDGTATAPIFLMGAPGEAKPIVRATLDRPIFQVTRAYWIVDGFEIDGAGFKAQGIRMEGATFSTARNNWVHGGSGPAAVHTYRDAHDIWLYRNKVYDYQWYVDGKRQDSHAFLVTPNATRVLIQENEAFHTSGDSFQCAGMEQVGFGVNDPTDIILEDNRFHHAGENAVDIKSCAQVTVRGGAKDSSKFYGHRPADDTVACAGAAVVIHYGARQILIERTRFWDNGMGLSIGRDDALAQDIVIRNNLFFNHHTLENGCGDGIRVLRAKNVSIYNNTFDKMARSAVRAGVENSATLTEGVGVWNNVIRNAAYAIDISTRTAPTFQSDRNLIWGGAASLRYNNKAMSLALWKEQTGFDGSSMVQDPLFFPDPQVQDYYTAVGSPARDGALRISGATYCGSGPDLGFLESCQ